ncbi:hypothetical protein GX441_09800 [bacterium]|nr:hypothetical protein [bacterium]
MKKIEKPLLMFIALAAFFIVAVPANAQLGGYWEKWTPACILPSGSFILYDYDNNSVCDTFTPLSGDGYIMFTNDSCPNDSVTEVDWWVSFVNGDREVIYLEDAS